MTHSIRNRVLACTFVLAVAASASNSAADDLPVIQVRLAPPERQLPQVAAEIGELSGLRQHLETDLMRQLDVAYKATLDAASAAIANLVDDSLSKRFTANGLGFARKLSDNRQFSIKVNVAPLEEPDASLKGSIERIEDKRATDERAMFDQACAEMNALSDILLNELGAELHAQVGRTRNAAFLQRRSSALPNMANVRVVASEAPFATVADLVELMEFERDQTESLERKHIMELEMRLIQAEKEQIAAALKRAVGRLLAM